MKGGLKTLQKQIKQKKNTKLNVCICVPIHAYIRNQNKKKPIQNFVDC